MSIVEIASAGANLKREAAIMVSLRFLLYHNIWSNKNVRQAMDPA